MKRLAVVLATVLTVVAFCPAIGMGATPFSAPAVFDLTGSQVGFSVALETKRLGTLDMALDPNPAMMTGKINIQTLNQMNGFFEGAFKDISASTTATLERIDLTFPITLTINSSNLSGWFLWQKDAVIFKPQSITATLSFGEKSWNLPFAGVSMPATYKDGILSANAELQLADTYLGYEFEADISIQLVGNLKKKAISELWIALQTDRPEYATGDQLKLYVSMGCEGLTEAVDLYLALAAPDGSVVFAPTYTTDPAPIISDWLPAKNIYLPSTLLYDIALPSASPPVSLAGKHQFLAAFVKAGTLELIGDFGVAEFDYSTVSSSKYPYDGTWYGSAVNEADNGVCSSTATMSFEISKNQIEGEADEDFDVESDGYDGYRVTGNVTAEGKISNGILLEEFGADYIQVGVLDGTISGSKINGAWNDVYGCYGSYTLNKSK